MTCLSLGEVYPTCVLPDQITVDGEPAMRNGIESTFNGDVDICNSKFINNRIEQGHRGIKDWYRNMRGFKDIFSALTLCTFLKKSVSILSHKKRREHSTVVYLRLNFKNLTKSSKLSHNAIKIVLI